jgi:uncharacterized protein YciI
MTNRLRLPRALAVLALLMTPACLSAGEPAGHPYALVLLKSGPRSATITPEESKTVFECHFANMGRLAQERRLVLAGPFGQPKRDPALRGVFVFDVPSVEDAQELAATDPGMIAGVFVAEAHTLRCSAPLQEFLTAELERKEQAKREGRTPKPGEFGRPYVLLTAEHGEAARRELEPLIASGQVLLWAALDGERAWAVLDAQDVPAAEALLGERAARIGAHVLDPWFAARGLEKLPTLGR